MAKYYGEIGFSETTETAPGVWTETITAKKYFGEVSKNYSRWQSSGNRNDDITISNQISILADPYANQNFSNMRYVEFMGAKWKVENVEVQYPRLNISLGGVYTNE